MANSPILGILYLSPTQNNKTTTINDAFAIIERSLNAKLNVSLASGDVELTTLNFQQHQVFRCTGHSVTRVLTVNNQERFFAVQNAGTGIVQVKTTSGSAQEVPVGSYVIFYLDGANVLTKIADSAAATAVTELIGLTDFPGDYTGHAGEFIRVNGTEDGVEFDELTVEDIANIETPVVNYYPRWKSDGSGIEWVSANPGGETEFLLLNDTPASYSGKALNFVRVASTEDELEFVAKNAALALLDLTDGPDSYAAQGGKIVAVKLDASGFEFIPPPSSGALVTRALTILNPGFEDDLTTGWTIDVGDPAYNTSTTIIDGVSADSGLLFYGTDADAETDAQISQTILLTDFAETSELDNNARVALTYSYVSIDGFAEGTVSVEFYNDLDVGLASFDVTGLIGAAGEWVSGSSSFDVPLGARTMKLIFASSTSETDLKFGWDTITGNLVVVEANNFLTLPDTPDDYTGQEDKFVRVNGDADGLVFVSLVSTMLDDMPSDLTGMAGRFLKVNVGETGYELDASLTHEDLEDTDLTDIADQRMLKWDDGASKFVAGYAILAMDQETYDGLGSYDPDTLYLITD